MIEGFIIDFSRLVHFVDSLAMLMFSRRLSDSLVSIFASVSLVNISGRSRVVQLCDNHTNETALHSRTTILDICQNRWEMGCNGLALECLVVRDYPCKLLDFVYDQ